MTDDELDTFEKGLRLTGGVYYADVLAALRRERDDYKLALVAATEENAKLRAALDAFHYYVCAHDNELIEAGITREDALVKAYTLHDARAAAQHEPAKQLCQLHEDDCCGADRTNCPYDASPIAAAQQEPKT